MKSKKDYLRRVGVGAGAGAGAGTGTGVRSMNWDLSLEQISNQYRQ